MSVVNDMNELSWTSSYYVQYKDKFGKWMMYNNSQFDGNTDAFSYNVNDVNIYTRYLRIVPITYHNYKSIRVHIYGPYTETDNTDVIDTITYKVIPHVNTYGKRYDGFGEYKCPEYFDWDRRYDGKARKRRHLKRKIKEYFDDL